MKKIFAFVMALILLGGVLAGCGPWSPSFAPNGTTQVGVLNLTGTDPVTLDPAMTGDMTSHQFIMQIFSGLVRLDENLQPAPDIAQEWAVSNGGRTYTFTLRQGVKFHSGRQVTASDFKYSWERACSPATRSYTAGSYLGDIVGVKDMIAGKANSISGVKVIDDYHLEVTIDAPKSYFLAKMSYPTAFVVDKDNVAAGKQWWSKPVGTGPFKLQEWKSTDQLTLKKNADYYGTAPGVDTVVYKLLAGSPLNLYEMGEIDVASISTADIYRVTDRAGPFYSQLLVEPELSFSYIGFNAKEPPFDDASVRRAFAMAIDKNKLAQLVFQGTVEVAGGILPPGMPGYNKDLDGLAFDPQKARDLVAASKYGSVSNLPPITLTTSGYGGLIGRDLEAVIAEWRTNLGVEVSVRQLEPDRFLYELRAEKDNMFDMGWIADYPHPQDFLEILFRTGSDNNYGEYSNPLFDALIDRANVETDMAASLKLYQQAEQMLINDAACIPLYFGENYVLVAPYVKGYRLTPQGLEILQGISIQK